MSKTRLASTTAVVLALTVVAAGVTATTSQASGGAIGGKGAGYYLSDTFSGKATTEYSYGAAADEVFVGDWDGDGIDTLSIRRGNTFHIRNSNSSGPADVVIAYGNTGDTILVGDWDGNGTDTLAVRRGNEYHIKNSISSGKADAVVHYGDTYDTVLVGDWDGNGTDTLAVRRDATFFFKNAMTTGRADYVTDYGNTGDRVLVGDWDGNRTDTLGVRRNNSYYLKNSISGGAADRVVVYGDTSDTTLVGDWDGNGTDTLGVRRTAVPRVDVAPVRPVTPPSTGNAVAAAIFRSVNASRASEGLGALTYDSSIESVAYAWSVTMGSGTGMVHNPSFSTQMRGGWTRVGENIAWASRGYPDYAQLFHESWMNSPGHRRNIMGDYTHIGIGIYTAPDGTVWATQNFGKY